MAEFSEEYDEPVEPDWDLLNDAKKEQAIEDAHAMVISIGGVNERVVVGDEDYLLDKLHRWVPEFRNGRVNLQDFRYKRQVLSEDGRRSYEIFQL